MGRIFEKIAYKLKLKSQKKAQLMKFFRIYNHKSKSRPGRVDVIVASIETPGLRGTNV